MNAIRKSLFAAMGCLSLAGPVSAAPDGTLGMALLSANVTTNGTLIKGVGVTSTAPTSDGAGTYEVIFDRNVSGCTYTATSTSFSVRSVSVQPRGTNVNGVYILMQDAAGANINTAFHLIVFCAN